MVGARRQAAGTTIALMVMACICGCASSEPSVAPAAVRSPGPASLNVGDPAPFLEVSVWVRGEPVGSFLPTRVYAVVFWSTYSGPSMDVFPRLSRIQRDNPDVVVVAVAATEPGTRDGFQEERLARVRRTVEGRGDELSVRIGYDGAGAMRETWLAAAGQREIPVVFIIGRDGRIHWIGHPDAMEGALAAAQRK
jgi:hypothetical protein